MLNERKGVSRFANHTVLNMPDIFNAPLDMRAYFESLPKSVQSAIVHSDVSADNLQQLKRLAAGYAGGIYAAEEK